MKKTVKISLGGIAFNLEDDAHAVLEEYFASLKRHLAGTPGADEIVRDIEERAAELLAEQLSKTEIVTLEMVNRVVTTLGRPEQITNDDAAEEDNQHSQSTNKRDRRLYRDSENAIVAGVCSGLAAYFNVDPLVFRILFAILVFAKGFGIIAYVIMWIAVPRAQTLKQRMEMRGEEVNFSNLEKNIRNEFDEVSRNIRKNKVSGVFEGIFGAIGQIFMALGRALGVVAKVIVAILAVLLIGIGLIGLMGSISSVFLSEFISDMFPGYTGLSLGQMLETTFDLGSVYWIIIPAFAVIVIPFLALILVGLRMVFRFNARGSIIFVAGATLWILAATTLAAVTMLQARSFTIRKSVDENAKIEFSNPKAATLYLKVSETNYTALKDSAISNRFAIEDYVVLPDGNSTRIAGKPRVFFSKSSSNNFEISVTKKSRGATEHGARKVAKSISMAYTANDSILLVDPFFLIPKGQKWRAQEVELTIGIPEGMSINIDKNMLEILGSRQNLCFCWPDELAGNTWKLVDGELIKQ